MIVIILNNPKRGTFWVEGTYDDWHSACEREKHINMENPQIDTYVVRLYKRNQHGAPAYPWFGDDSGDE